MKQKLKLQDELRTFVRELREKGVESNHDVCIGCNNKIYMKEIKIKFYSFLEVLIHPFSEFRRMKKYEAKQIIPYDIQKDRDEFNRILGAQLRICETRHQAK